MAKKRSKSKKKGGKKYQIEMTSLSVFLWSFCLFFLLAWIFVLGILVGRGFLPDLKIKISKLEDMINHDRPKRLDSQKKADADLELSFYEKLSNKQIEEKKEAAPKKRETPQKAPPKKEIVRPEREKDQRPAGDLKKLPEESPKSSPSELEYTIQLASLGDRNKAKALIKDLIDRGYPAYFYEVRVKGKYYYRVRCGKFANRKEAGKYAGKLEREAGIKGFVSRLE
jgi:cell division septation protein DedD